MLQVKTFTRNDKDKGPRSFWKGHDPLSVLDEAINEFCKIHDVKDILHFPPSIYHNRYFVVIYNE